MESVITSMSCDTAMLSNMKVISTEYFPETIKHNKRIAARYKIVIYKKWPYCEKYNHSISLNVWGELAEKCCKNIYAGSVLSCVASCRTYTSRIIYKGKAIKDENGEYATTLRSVWTMNELLTI